MNHAIILDMPTLTARSLEADPAARGFVDGLLARASHALGLSTDPVRELLERAKAYEATQPSFAADLRAAAAAAKA